MHSSTRKIVVGGAFFGIICLIAVVVYILAGWSLLDAIYMVIITIFGVGYGEVQPLESPGLKVFTIGLIVFGCSSLIYVTGGFLQMITEGEINRALGKRRNQKELTQLLGHTIICGYGRVGRVLADELERSGLSIVVVEAGKERAAEAEEKGFLTVLGNATEEATLEAAGALRARTLATVLPDDALNVFITLTAHELNPELEIIARAESPSTERKLLRSGASKVVVPAALGAAHISQLMTLPSAEALFEEDANVLGERLAAIGLNMNHFRIDEDSPFAGRSIRDIAQEARGGLVAVAVLSSGGEMERQPDGARHLAPGETLVALCNREDMERIAKRVTGKSKRMYGGWSTEQARVASCDGNARRSYRPVRRTTQSKGSSLSENASFNGSGLRHAAGMSEFGRAAEAQACSSPWKARRNQQTRVKPAETKARGARVPGLAR